MKHPKHEPKQVDHAGIANRPDAEREPEQLPPRGKRKEVKERTPRSGS